MCRNVYSSLEKYTNTLKYIPNIFIGRYMQIQFVPI